MRQPGRARQGLAPSSPAPCVLPAGKCSASTGRGAVRRPAFGRWVSESADGPAQAPHTKGWVCTRQRGGSSELSEGPLLPISTATIKETGDDQRWAGCGDTGRVCTVGRMRDGAAAGGSRAGRRFLEALSVALPWGPAAPPLALGPGHLNIGAQRDGATVTCRAARCAVARQWMDKHDVVHRTWNRIPLEKGGDADTGCNRHAPRGT